MKKYLLFILTAFIFHSLNSADAKFIVVSDTHLYDTIFGCDGDAFQKYLDSDRKLLKESSAILDKFISDIDTIDYNFIIVSGDLTKDGEAACHSLFREKMDYLIDKGKKIFVINGNHDINNPDAHSFSGNNIDDEESIDEGFFKKHYFEYGYSEAVSCDTASLSYEVNPIDNLYVIALDGCRYDENYKLKTPVTGGKLKKETFKWLEKELKKIKAQNGTVIVFMHHGVIEHFKGQKKGYGDYILSNNKELKNLFSKYNVQIVFTGHFHANDIAREKVKNVNLFDIETGSLVTSPCPYRIVTLSDSILNIDTRHIEELDGVDDFNDYKTSFIKQGIKQIAYEKVKSLGVNEKDTDRLADKVAYSFVSHYSGDEVYPEGFLDMNGFSFKAKLVAFFQRDLFRGLLFDSTPDNDVIINLNTGEIKKIE